MPASIQTIRPNSITSHCCSKTYVTPVNKLERQIHTSSIGVRAPERMPDVIHLGSNNIYAPLSFG